MFLTLIIAIAALVALMVIHEFGHFIIAKKFGVKVEEFGIGYPPRIYGKQFGDTLYSINLLPLGAFVKIYGEEGDVDDYRSFSNLAIWKRILIVLGGVLAFWIASMVIFSAVFLAGVKVPVGDQDVVGVYDTNVQILEVAPDSPAKLAGLETGDIVLQARGTQSQDMLEVDKVKDFQEFVKAHDAEQLELVIARHGVTAKTLLQPRQTYPEGQGPTGVVLERMANLIQKAAWYEAPVQGVIYTGTVTFEALKGIYNVVASLFAGKGVPAGAELAGPVGITIFISKAADYGVGFFLYFIGSLSVLLAIFNLFPIPALDGGKLVFLIIEKIKGSPVSVKLEQRLTITCFIILITLSLFVTVKFDIPRVIDLWKAGF